MVGRADFVLREVTGQLSPSEVSTAYRWKTGEATGHDAGYRTVTDACEAITRCSAAAWKQRGILLQFEIVARGDHDAKAKASEARREGPTNRRPLIEKSLEPVLGGWLHGIRSKRGWPILDMVTAQNERVSAHLVPGGIEDPEPLYVEYDYQPEDG